MERHQGVGGRLEPRLLAWGKTPAAIGILCSPQEIEARGERFAHLQFQEVDRHLGGQSALFRYSFRIRASRVERKHARSKAGIAGWKPAPHGILIQMLKLLALILANSVASLAV